MSVTEHNVITFLKAHGQDIVAQQRNKNHPIRPNDLRPVATSTEKPLQQQKLKIEKLEQENKRFKSQPNDWLDTNKECLEKYKFYKHQYKLTQKELQQTKIELATNKECLEKDKKYLEKYNFYKHQYKLTKKELQQTKIELVNTQEELVHVNLEVKKLKLETSTLKQELMQLKLAFSKLKGKRKVKKINSASSSNTEKSKQIKLESSTEVDTDNNKERDRISYLDDKVKEEAKVMKENEEIVTALGNIQTLGITPKAIETKTDNIVHKNTKDTNYPKEINPNLALITRGTNKLPRHRPIGQHNEFQDVIGSVTQGINMNGYLVNFDNIYAKQELTLLVTNWKLALMHLNYLKYYQDNNVPKYSLSITMLPQESYNKSYFPTSYTTAVCKDYTNIAHILPTPVQPIEVKKDMITPLEIMASIEVKREMITHVENIEEVKTPLENMAPIDHYPIDKLPNRNPNDLDLVLNISRSNILYEDKFLLQKDLSYYSEETTVKMDLCTHYTDPPLYTKPHIVHCCIYTSLVHFIYNIYNGLSTHILCRQTKIKEKYANSGPKAKQRDIPDLTLVQPVIPVLSMSYNNTYDIWNNAKALSCDSINDDIMTLMYYTQDNTSWYDDTIFYISEKEPD